MGLFLRDEKRHTHNATEDKDNRQGGGGDWWDRLVIISRSQEKGKRKIHKNQIRRGCWIKRKVREGEGEREQETGRERGGGVV